MEREWVLYLAGPMLMLFVIGTVFVIWYYKKRRYDKDLDHLKTMENIKRSREDGSLSEEDYKVIAEAAGQK